VLQNEGREPVQGREGLDQHAHFLVFNSISVEIDLLKKLRELFESGGEDFNLIFAEGVVIQS
jgi:hypothetical protein